MKWGSVLILVAALLWSLDGILRRSLFDLPPITIVFFEHVIGLLFIAPFLFTHIKDIAFSRREWVTLASVALLSGVLGTLFFTSALLAVGFISFSVVFLLQKLQPVFAIASAWVMLRERPHRSFFIFAFVALVAAYFVTFPRGVVVFSESGNLLAALFAFLAAVSWGTSTTLSRALLKNHNQTLVTGMRFLLTVPFAFVFLLGLGALPSAVTLTLPQVGTFALIALSTGMVALWIYYRGLRTTPASTATILELAFPLSAVVIDYFLYGTTLLGSQYVAAGVLLWCMYRIARLKIAT